MCFSHYLIYLNTRRIAASKRGDQFYSEWFILAVLEFFSSQPRDGAHMSYVS